MYLTAIEKVVLIGWLGKTIYIMSICEPKF